MKSGQLHMECGGQFAEQLHIECGGQFAEQLHVECGGQFAEQLHAECGGQFAEQILLPCHQGGRSAQLILVWSRPLPSLLFPQPRPHHHHDNAQCSASCGSVWSFQGVWMSVEHSASMCKSCMRHSGVVKETEQKVEKPNWGERKKEKKIGEGVGQCSNRLRTEESAHKGVN